MLPEVQTVALILAVAMGSLFLVFLWIYVNPTRRQKHLGEGATNMLWLYSLLTARFVHMALGYDFGTLTWVLFGVEVLLLGAVAVSTVRLLKRRIRAGETQEAKNEEVAG